MAERRVLVHVARDRAVSDSSGMITKAIRASVVAALAAPAIACGSGDTCTLDRPSPVPTTCGAIYEVGFSSVKCLDGGLTASTCADLCAQQNVTCTAAGSQITCQAPFCGKARTSLRRARSRGSPLAAHLRDSVWLEAASVDAFRTLARELAAHGAPQTLSRAARDAARDETRHARAMRELAKRYGVVARTRPKPRRRKPRALVDIAIENAVEGCVYETFGAALAAFQAQRATDARDRKTMRDIARDEMRHAVLAARVDRWMRRRLAPNEDARITKARDEAVRRLLRDVRRVPRVLVDVLGMPNANESDVMARAISATLWSRGTSSAAR